MFRYLLIIGFIITILSCSNEQVEKKCDQYFLNKVTQGDNTTTIFYNSDALISAMVSNWNGLREDFIYDVNNKLIEVIWGNGKTKFRYNAVGQLVATLRFLDGEQFDSLSYVYDELDRIVKREFHSGTSNNAYFESYVSISYPSSETLKADFYRRVGEEFVYSSTFTYVLDGKPKPFPQEYYLYYISWSNIFLTSNPTSLSISGTINPSVTNYEYHYNSDGYPIREDFHSYRYKYLCKPLQE